ncbi:hypothetical protein EV368DRAFT_70169 [Lentinula lateritia]|nr:hypothetical protein EV368DRAFT_70169 [Lentinula lateritia]
MSASQSTQTLRGFTPFSVQTSGDSTIFDSMSLEDLEVEMELSQKHVANILKAQNSLKRSSWDAMKPQRDDEDEDAEVASVTEPEIVDLVADLPYGFLQLPEAKHNSQWYIKRLRLYSEIECRLLGVRMQEESKKYCLLNWTKKNCRGVYIGEATNSETGKPGNNFWNVVDAELQTIREKKGNDPVRISRFFARILKNDCDVYDPDSVESLKELIETSSVSLNDE